MIEFFDSDISFRPDKKYEEFYKTAYDEGVKYKTLFVLLASLGFRNVEKIDVIDHADIEFKASELSEKDKLALYTILLKDKNLNIGIEDLFNKDKFFIYEKTLVGYAAGGLEYIVEEYLDLEDLDDLDVIDHLPEKLLEIVYKDLNKSPF